MPKNRYTSSPAPIAWHKNLLVCGTYGGEVRILKFNVEAHKNSDETEKYTGCFSHLYSEHSRLIHTVNLIGSTVVSTSQDRSFVGYSLHKSKVQFNIPTIGCAINSIAFNPHATHWLALGLQDGSIKFVDLQGYPPIKNKSISLGIKGKVLALHWHPTEENLILYGTADGQVGVVDTGTKKINTYSSFHQRPVYNVCWAPKLPLSDERAKSPARVVYSFSHQDIMMRDPIDFMAEPTKMCQMVSNFPSDLSEFSFSRDYKYLACGSHGGEVYIINTLIMKIVVKCIPIRKTIQHIIWKEPNTSSKYSIAIASNDSKVCIQEFDEVIATQEKRILEGTDDTQEVQILSSSTRELVGHVGRVVFLSFSPHNTDLLVTSSYDHTCQVWHSGTGERLGNYRGHLSRSMRAVFSPDQPGLIYSFCEDSCLHQWRLKCLIHKAPPNKVNKLIDPKIVQNIKSVDNKETTPAPAKVPEKKRTPAHKSLFPLLHMAASHKRGFYLLATLSLYLHKEATQRSDFVCEEGKDEDLQNILEKFNDAELNKTENDSNRSTLEYFKDAAISLPVLAEEEGKVIQDQDAEVFLDFYGPPSQIKRFLDKQLDHHKSNCNTSGMNTIQCWKGDTEAAVKLAISEKKLNADLVAISPQVSHSLWMSASESYAYQLSESGEPLLAVNYFLNANKIEDAVEMLLKHKLYREALTLAKVRLPFSMELHKQVINMFAAVSMSDGFYDMGALLKGSLGEGDDAATYLCRRGDSSSLLLAALLYQNTNHPNTNATFLECLRTCGSKLEFQKIANVLDRAPHFSWFRCVAVTLEYLVVKLSLVMNPGEVKTSEFTLQDKDYHVKEGSEVKCVVRAIIDRLKRERLCEEENYSALVLQMSTCVHPTSLKMFWYLVSVELTKLLLAVIVAPSDASKYLTSLLALVMEWGRLDGVYDVTHCIAPAGLNNLDCCLTPLPNDSEGRVLFRQLYIISEFHLKSTQLLCLKGHANTQDQQLTIQVFQQMVIEEFLPLFAVDRACKIHKSSQLLNTELYKNPTEEALNIIRRLIEDGIISNSILENF